VSGDLRKFLIYKFAKGDFSAKDVCTIAALAGNYAVPLGISDLAATGHESRHLKSVLGCDRFAETDMFYSSIPIADSSGTTRLQLHPFMMPHEMASKFPHDWNIPNESESLHIPAYKDAAVLTTRQAGEKVTLIQGYCDAAPYTGAARSQPDSVYIITVCPVDRLSDINARRLFTVIKKRNFAHAAVWAGTRWPAFSVVWCGLCVVWQPESFLVKVRTMNF
jgi:hypothetical protein